jgi:hypothetical protein
MDIEVNAILKLTRVDLLATSHVFGSVDEGVLDVVAIWRRTSLLDYMLAYSTLYSDSMRDLMSSCIFLLSSKTMIASS